MESAHNEGVFLARLVGAFLLLFYDLQLVAGESKPVSEKPVVNVSVGMENDVPHVKSPLAGIFSICFSVRIPITRQKGESSLRRDWKGEPAVLGSNEREDERTACGQH